MAVSSVNNNSNGGNYGTGNSAADLSESFMTLLVAQMQNQDPTNPMDNNQLTAQLAQFNTAAGVEKLNSSVTNVQAMMQQLGSLSSASWIGRNVLIEGDPKVTFGSGSGNGITQEGVERADSFNFALTDDADTVTVTFTDTKSDAVYTAELKNVKAGVNTYTLDDLKDIKPEPGPTPGTEYTVTFDAKNTQGENPKATGLMQSQVTGVTMLGQTALLYLNNHEPIGMTDVIVIQK